MSERIKKCDIVQNIKDVGQSLIDNAEKIANDYKYLRGMKITCYVDLQEQYPYYNVDTDIIPENTIERFLENEK